MCVHDSQVHIILTNMFLRGYHFNFCKLILNNLFSSTILLNPLILITFWQDYILPHDLVYLRFWLKKKKQKNPLFQGNLSALINYKFFIIKMALNGPPIQEKIYNHQLYLIRLNVVLDVAFYMFEIIRVEFKYLVKSCHLIHGHTTLYSQMSE